MCARWFESVCETDVCWMSVCAMSSGVGFGVLRAMAVEARAFKEVLPAGVSADDRVAMI